MQDRKALRRYGLRLLDGETIQGTYAVPKGFCKKMCGEREALLLTDRRLVYLKGSWGSRSARAAALQDVSYMELGHKERTLCLLLWGVLLVPLLIGVCFLWAWWMSGETTISTHIGGEPKKIPVPSAVLPDAEEFVAAFFARKEDVWSRTQTTRI